MVDTDDIAKVASEQLLAPFTDPRSITYISSDERHPQEIATAMGTAIGKPDLKWITFTDENAYNGMLQAGLNESFATLYRDMGHALRTGALQEDYWRSKHTPQGQLKLERFAERFAGAYNAQ